MVGSGMAAAVVVDSLLSKTRRSHSAPSWKIARGVAFFSIILGGWITYGSNSRVRWYDLSLVGESLMLFGFAVWVHLKTYQGDGNRSRLSQALKKFVLID